MEESTSKPTPRPKRRNKFVKKITNVRHAEQMMLSALVFDVDSLLKKFNEISGSSFEEFGQIFIDKEFPTIFLGRYSTSELVEFGETLLSYSSRFMFTNNESDPTPPFLHEPTSSDVKKIALSRKERPLKERIFGIYLCYCLYFTQPQSNVSNIKLSVYQMKELRDFCQRELLSEQRFEALFCINRLIDEHAFMVVPFEKEFNPVLVHRFDLTHVVADTLDISDETNNEPLPSLKNIERDYTLMQTDLIHKRYMDEKKRHKLPAAMSIFEDSLLSKITEIVAKTERDLERLD